MPYNSFENYPLSWIPDKSKLTYPLYISIAEQLETHILNGHISGNTKLPPQRELADFLDISLSTVTKAYELCAKKGLVTGRSGSGTYVCPNVGLPRSVVGKPEPSGYIQMGTIFPLDTENKLVLSVVAKLLESSDSNDLFSYGNFEKNEKHLAAARKWMSSFLLDSSLQNIVLTTGAQNALTVTLMSLFSAGDKIATDVYTYSNFIGLANMLGMRLVAVEGDENGMLPDALDTLCRNSNIKGIYLMPLCSNPLNISMPSDRQIALSEIIKKNHLILIEDGIYSFLSDNLLPPMSNYVPDHSVYINSVSKALCSGLRIGFIGCSKKFLTKLEYGTYNCNLKTSTLNLEIASEIILQNLHIQVINKKIKNCIERNSLFNTYFPESPRPKITAAYFRWLHLPKGLTGKSLEIQSSKCLVKVLGAERFAINDTADSSAVRLALCSPPTSDQLETGLGIIRSIIGEYNDPTNTPMYFL